MFVLFNIDSLQHQCFPFGMFFQIFGNKGTQRYERPIFLFDMLQSLFDEFRAYALAFVPWGDFGMGKVYFFFGFDIFNFCYIAIIQFKLEPFGGFVIYKLILLFHKILVIGYR